MELIIPDKKKAKKILNLIRDIILILPGDDLFVEDYVNGRESGYKVHNYKKAIVFSVYRNSDSLVLYIGQYRESREPSGISNRMYDNKEFFAPNDYHGVVSAGLSYLIGRPR